MHRKEQCITLPNSYVILFYLKGNRVNDHLPSSQKVMMRAEAEAEAIIQ